MLLNYARLFFLHKMATANVLIVGFELKTWNAGKCGLGSEQIHYHCWVDKLLYLSVFGQGNGVIKAQKKCRAIGYCHQLESC